MLTDVVCDSLLYGLEEIKRNRLSDTFRAVEDTFHTSKLLHEQIPFRKTVDLEHLHRPSRR